MLNKSYVLKNLPFFHLDAHRKCWQKFRLYSEMKGATSRNGKFWNRKTLNGVALFCEDQTKAQNVDFYTFFCTALPPKKLTHTLFNSRIHIT
jgi:hypothetical protein